MIHHAAAPQTRARIDGEELIAQLEGRSETYALLARLYREEIGRDLLEQLHGMLFPCKTGNADMDEGYRLIAVYLSNLWGESADELAADYARCFIGHGPNATSAAFPFESVYTSGKHLLMGEARDEVLAIYRAYGVERAREWKEGEDHMALELEFVRILCDRSIKALQGHDKRGARTLIASQRAFLEDHLCAWAPQLAADMQRFAQTKLYKGLARLTTGFLADDHLFLDEMLRTDAMSAQ